MGSGLDGSQRGKKLVEEELSLLVVVEKIEMRVDLVRG